MRSDVCSGEAGVRRALTPDMSKEAVDVGRCTKRITSRIINA
jgi:hypothetical protein